ncbi:ABC transporter permease [Synoicihabitans lomoniglobus]|uniref:ABC transporter permease n=1 Tax=Synoicihabitans lomoniglobus TaxID=2909285 RepID=A0AAF0CIQ6_9BACT|nr:ABC transporter permease [Opitutaceae bacterium LMO-M01]WED65672.1 ABC transporter permease [Opitutaceae bacterium LMO-M01]
MKDLLADFQDALRQLRRAPGFSSLAVVLLAVGLGSTVAIFSLFHSIVLQPLPYNDPGRLVGFRSLNHAKALDQEGVSPTDFRDFIDRSTQFEALGAVRPNFIAYTPEEGTPVQLINGLVTPDFFTVFKVQPILGRTFASDEFSFSSARTVVLSEEAWERYFGRDAAVLGASITLDDVPHTVIGVMPASFREPTFVEAWIPFPDESPEYFARDSRFWNGFGRLAAGANLAAANAEVRGISQDLAREYPESNRDWTTAIRSLLEQRTAGIRTNLLLLLGAVGLVLLIVCFNLANLLLARCIARLPELGVRLALGATPIRLARTVVFESFVLALIGGLIGTALAAVALPIVADQIPPVLLPRAHEVALDWSAVGVGLLAALVSALLCAALPAWQLSTADVNQWLKDGAARGATSRGVARWQSPLVSGQVALTVTVLAVAMLLMQSLVRLNQVPPGFNADEVMTLRLSPPASRYETNEELVRYYEDLLTVVEEVPGVGQVSINASAPLNGITLAYPSWRQGTNTDATNAVEAVYAPISEGFFRTLQIPVHAGRTFSDHDNAEGAPVAVINEAYARRMFPDGNALGQRVMILPWMGAVYREVVGIVGDTRQTSLAEPPLPQIYVPQKQMPWFFSTLLVRLDRASATTAVIAALRAHDSTLPVSPTALTTNIAQGATASRLYAYLFGGFAVLALSLSAFGLHASLRFSLEQRLREIAVRIALGASPASIRQLMIRRAGRLTGIGLAGGVVFAVPTTLLLRGQLFGIGPSDPITYLLLIGVIAGVTTLTAYPLARRASRVPPATILQSP